MALWLGDDEAEAVDPLDGFHQDLMTFETRVVDGVVQVRI